MKQVGSVTIVIFNLLIMVDTDVTTMISIYALIATIITILIHSFYNLVLTVLEL